MNLSKTTVRMAALCCLGVILGVVEPGYGLVPPKTDPDPVVPEFKLVMFGQIFAGHETTVSEAQSFNEFVLRRAEAGLGLTYKKMWGFTLNIEGIRSAGPRSLNGIDINSIAMRVKQGFVYAEPEIEDIVRFQIRAGMIPDVWVGAIENQYDLRGMSPLLSEQGQFFDTSDLGASIAASFLDELVTLRIAFTNGEGRNEVERNEGKNATFVLSTRPVALRLWHHRLDIMAHAMYRDGSLGPASTQNHRFGGALTVLHPNFSAGAEYIQATGYRTRPDINANGLGIWASGNLYFEWLGAYGRFSTNNQNQDVSDASSTQIDAGLYLDAFNIADAPRTLFGFPRMRLYLGYRNTSFGAAASPVPGTVQAANNNTIVLMVSGRANSEKAPNLTASRSYEQPEKQQYVSRETVNK